MRDREAIGKILAGTSDPSQRTLYFSALLAQEAGLREGLIVVGGSAIEIYTHGAYVSGDIDVIGPRARIERVLRDWGFQKDGRTWWSAEWKLVIDIVRSEGYTGSEVRLRVFESPYGTVRVAAVEDLIIGRLASTKFWKLPEDLKQATLLAIEYVDTIDWGYVELRASKEDVSDLLVELRHRASSVTTGRQAR